MNLPKQLKSCLKAFFDNKIILNFESLVTDYNGNYVIGCICKFLQENEIVLVLEAFLKLIPDVFKNFSTVKCFQEVIKQVRQEKEVAVLNEIIERSFDFCVGDQNRIHILNSYINNVTSPKKTVIFDLIINKFEFVWRSKYSKTLIESFILCRNQEYINKFVMKIGSKFFEIADHECGNFAITATLKLTRDASVYSYFRFIMIENLAYFTKEKYRPHVLEELLKFEHEIKENDLKTDLLSSNLLPSLLLNEDAFFVLVKLVSYSTAEEIEIIRSVQA